MSIIDLVGIFFVPLLKVWDQEYRRFS